MPDFIVRFRAGPDLHARLQRLRSERHVNVSAWLRNLVSAALDEQPGLEPQLERSTPAPNEPPESKPEPPPEPLPGWRPAQLPASAGGGWGAAFEGDADALPDDLAGAGILVRTRSGASWIATVEEVVERSAQRVLVRAPRPA